MGIVELWQRAVVMSGLISTAFCCQKSPVQNQIQKETVSIINQDNSEIASQHVVAYAQGVQEAKQEIKNNAMTYYVFGEEPDYPYSIETGLPVKIITGCMVSDSIVELVAGHNQTIRAHLKSLVRDDEIQRATSHVDAVSSYEYRRNYYQGMQEAYNEIKNDKLTRYVYGKGNWGDKDKTTGVTIKVIAGCIVSDSIIGLADGHNYIIMKYLNNEIK